MLNRSHMRIEQINHIDGSITYEVTIKGRTISLTPEQAFNVLAWLYDRKGDIMRQVNAPDQERDTGEQEALD